MANFQPGVIECDAGEVGRELKIIWDGRASVSQMMSAIEVNHAKRIVRTFGKLGDLGYNTESVGDGGLNSPYDAKRIGDKRVVATVFEMETIFGVDQVFDRLHVRDGELKEIHSFYYPQPNQTTAAS